MSFSGFFDLPNEGFDSDTLNQRMQQLDQIAVPAQFEPTDQTQEIERIGIAGAGMMGCAIAAVCIKAGISVLLFDPIEEACRTATQRVMSELSDFSSEEKNTILDGQKLKTTSDPMELGTVPVILETIPEKSKLKQKFYLQLDRICLPDTILFSNTSTICISELSTVFREKCQNISADRFCGLHFFHPVRKRRLVEIIRGRDSSTKTLQIAVALGRKIGKIPVVVNDGPAFLVNRMLNPYLSESMTLLEEGAPMRTIIAACERFGMELNPFRLMDEIGLDVALHSGWTVKKAFPELVTSEEILLTLIDNKRLGRKSGAGFFRYSKSLDSDSLPEDDSLFDELLTEIRNKKKRQEEKSGQSIHQENSNWTEEEVAARIFTAVLLEAGRIVEAGIVSSFELTDLALLRGLGFPQKRGGIFYWAEQFGFQRLLEYLHRFQSRGVRYKIPNILAKKMGETLQN